MKLKRHLWNRRTMKDNQASLEAFIRSMLTGRDFTVNAIRQTRDRETGGLVVELFIPHDQVKNNRADA